MMLGVTRPSVTIACKVLIDRSLIAHSRNRIRILDREGLETLACECYRVVRDHLDNYIEFETGFTV
jgi:Mn-dependent DtxR family transcriptional regulator